MNHPTGSRDLIRAINRSAVLNTIRTNGLISRTQVARLTGLSPATISGITAELMEDDLILEKAPGNSRGGRRPILLALNPRAGYVAGLKLTEDHVVGAMTDLEATVIANHTSQLRDHALDTAIVTLADVVEALMVRAGIARDKLLGVGVGLAGIIDAGQGVLRHSPIFGWRSAPFIELLRARLDVLVHIDNDVNTLTITEQLFGAGQGVENFLTVTVGRGVGMGIVVNGQLYRGLNGGAGEFGHTVLDPNGPLCACGNRGCLETYVSDPSLMRLAAEAVSRGELDEKVRDIDDLLTRARGGNQAAQAIFAQAGEALGRGVANLINIFSPELVIISGEGVRAGETLFGPMRGAISRHVMFGLAEDTKIQIDVWEDDAWARGAAGLVLEVIFRSPFHRGQPAPLRS